MAGATPVKVAAVDIGTNSVRLLIADTGAGGTHALTRLVAVTRLGEGVDNSGILTDSAMERTVHVLARYGEVASAEGATAVAVATSAVRDAANREEFLQRATAVLGVRPRLLSGAEEADMSRRGAAEGWRRPLAVIDVGGGSTEFSFSSGDAYSIDIGSVRLTERHLPTRPAAEAQVTVAMCHVAGLMSRIEVAVPPVTVLGVGGTFTSLAAIHLDLDAYDPDVVHGTKLEEEVLGRQVERLASMTVEETAGIPSLDPGRAPVLLGGAIVALQAVRRLRTGSVTVSEHDLLWALAGEAAQT